MALASQSTDPSDPKTQQRMRGRYFGIVLVLVILMIVGISALGRSGGLDGRRNCTLDLLVEDTPEGWTLRRDPANGCAWTLFNEQGERAPDDRYGHLSVEPPGPVFLYPTRVVGVGAIAISVLGILTLAIRAWVGRRNTLKTDA